MEKLEYENKGVSYVDNQINELLKTIEYTNGIETVCEYVRIKLFEKIKYSDIQILASFYEKCVC